MRIIVVILIVAALVSCAQKQAKDISKNESPTKALEMDSIEITDSMEFDNYVVEADTAYFYARTDLSTKMPTYLRKRQWTAICKTTDEFGYAVRLTDSSIERHGWLRLKDLKQISFTPPKIVKEEK